MKVRNTLAAIGLAGALVLNGSVALSDDEDDSDRGKFRHATVPPLFSVLLGDNEVSPEGEANAGDPNGRPPEFVEPSFETVLAYAALGLIVGFVYYMSMRSNAGLPADAPSWMTKLLHGLRLAAAIVLFAWLAFLGMVPILSAFAGFLAGRVIAFRVTGEDA